MTPLPDPIGNPATASSVLCRRARASRTAREPFKILPVSQIRRLCGELTGPELKVWLYQFSRSGEKDTSFARLDTIARETNQNVQTVKIARKSLRDRGWSETVGWLPAHRGRVPIERAVFPEPASLRVEKPPSVASNCGCKNHQVENPPTEVDSKSIEVREPASDLRFPLISATPTPPVAPMTALSPRTLEEKRLTARSILIRNGHDSDSVEIALLRVANLAAAKKKIPRTVRYFVASVENSLADEDEAAACRSIADDRRRSGVPLDATLRPEEWHNASKVAFVHSAVEEACSLGRSSREIIAERLAAAEAVGSH